MSLALYVGEFVWEVQRLLLVIHLAALPWNFLWAETQCWGEATPWCTNPQLPSSPCTTGLPCVMFSDLRTSELLSRSPWQTHLWDVEIDSGLTTGNSTSRRENTAHRKGNASVAESVPLHRGWRNSVSLTFNRLEAKKLGTAAPPQLHLDFHAIRVQMLCALIGQC